MPAPSPPPRLYRGVMVSSTFTDLKEHRAALIQAIEGEDLMPVAMDHDAAKTIDVIESSLRMVRDASAYIGLIGHKYGQTPTGDVSITELEFNEAQRLDRPILLFIMGDDHPVRKADVETDALKLAKLNAFRERAKQMKGSLVHRVYATFDSLEDFTAKAIHSVADLRREIEEKEPAAPPLQPVATSCDAIPTPPAFYAEPPYIGSHKFVGRQAQLDVLSDWAAPADAHPVLLFDAIGGSGKSMLTWEWTTRHATAVRDNWSGRFWYSFYERGAVMADFCRRALAYITGEPLDSFKKAKTPELAGRLLHYLRRDPWLFVLDGLERVLVAYHRIDAADLPDEEASRPTDQIARRDPCSAIRPEDDDLLRALAAASPSKLIISSRLVPRVLLNQASQPIPDVLRVALPGLRPPDAEALLRSCGIDGDPHAIQVYLKSHCDCHPLVTGIVAGLINDYLPAKGNFDSWAADPDGGGRLNLADLDLVQKRNHILKAALNALPEKRRQLLSTLALLSEAADYPTLRALNPHLPPEPEKVEVPSAPRVRSWLSDAARKQEQQEYQAALERRKEYEKSVEARLRSAEYLAAPRELTNTVRDLERRGLLQYDGLTRRYDLHPVVRGIAAGGLRQEEKDRYGQRVLDHFSEKPHSPYEEAEDLEDVHDGIHLVRTLLKMGRYQRAFEAFRGDLAIALLFNLEANAELLSLLQPFFLQGWAVLPIAVEARDASYLATCAGFALFGSGELDQALSAHGSSLASDLRTANWAGVHVSLSHIDATLSQQNRLAHAERCLVLSVNLATLIDNNEALFVSRLRRFYQLARIGQWDDAQAIWELLDPMGRAWSRTNYRPGLAEYAYATCRYWQGNLTEEHLADAERLAKAARDRATLRMLYGLRGEWRLERAEWTFAAESLEEAVSMARAVGQTGTKAETQLALARFHLDQITDPRLDAGQLATVRQPSHRALASLWLAIGDREQAQKHALAAYRWAWAAGEPYVNRYELTKSRALLETLGVPIPDLPPFDPAKYQKLPWEDDVENAIGKLKVEKARKAKPPIFPN